MVIKNSRIKLSKSSQDDIYFDDKSNIYITDDNGRILKYKIDKLGI